MATKIVWKSSAVQDILDGGQGVREDLRNRAERVLKHAQADPHDKTGDYERSLHITEDHTDRLVVRVVAGAPHGHLVEAKYGVLAKALDAAGGA